MALMAAKMIKQNLKKTSTFESTFKAAVKGLEKADFFLCNFRITTEIKPYEIKLNV